MASSLSEKERGLIDAYWRAANYLSVGQIYLLDNPLLREPLTAGAHQAAPARPLGHHAGPELHLRAPEPRHQRSDDLDMIYVAGPGHGGPGVVANAYLEGTYSEVYPDISQDEHGHEAAVQAVLVSRRHPEPRRARDAGLDPRRRRAGLRAVARLRRRVRQSRPDRRLRRRRRRGGDRPAGDELALQQVPQSRHATARCCRSCISTATRSPTRRCSRASRTRSSSTCSAATATRRTSSRATIRWRCTSRWRRRSTRSSAEIRRIQDAARSEGIRRAAALADDRAAHAQGLDLARRRSTASATEGYWRAHQVPLARHARQPGARRACSSSG